jgi:predicted small lipoprotein YifL
MLNFKLIVGIAFILGLLACGQRGSLVLPKEPAAQNRATLPQVLSPAPTASSPR